MSVSRLRLAALAAVGGLGLSGCAYGMYGDDYGYGYGYPRSGVSVSIGSGYGYGSPYGGYYGSYGYPYGGYGSYGYGYGGYDPFGWYGNYYYPGTGIYVYDRNRTRYRWTDQQRRYWQERRDRWRSRTGSATPTTSTSSSENWSGWSRPDRHRRDNTTTTSNWTRPERGSGGSWQRSPSVTRQSGEKSEGHHSRERVGEKPD